MRLPDLAWPIDSIPEIFELLLLESRMPLRREPLPPFPDLLPLEQRGDTKLLDEQLEAWLRGASRARDVEAESTSPTFEHFEEFLLRGGPAVVFVYGGSRNYVLALVGRRGKFATFMLPSKQIVQVRAVALRDELFAEWCELIRGQARFVQGLGLAYEAQESLRLAFLKEGLFDQEVASGWMLQVPTSAPLKQQLQRAHLLAPMLLLLLSAVGSAMLALLGWYAIGANAMSGHIDRGRLLAWALVLLMSVPLAGLATHAQGHFSLRLAMLFKRILLQGCLNLPTDEVRQTGPGKQLALLTESLVLEEVSLSASFTVLIALTNIASATYLFWLVPAARHLIWLQLAGLVIVLLSTRLLYLTSRLWTDQRLMLTDNLVAKMRGHRTRRVQQPEDQWHEGEDELLADYWQSSQKLDQRTIGMSLLPRAWLLAAVVLLTPLLLSPTVSPLLAVMVGVLLSYQSLSSLIQGLSPLVQVKLGLDILLPPLRAAAAIDHRPITYLSPAAQRAHTGPIVEVIDVVFRFRPQGQAVLRGCNLSIFHGDRILLEGNSGGGKSTLASLITGLRSPESGLVLVSSYDQHSLNRDAWRRMVATAPQFHENYIFSNTLAFNLLMGRNWPPSDQDIHEAEALCHELALGSLLDRMPNGIWQLVGERGWQLSHGEKSRIFIARALLQRSEVLLLDESFGPLDPETLEFCMATVLRHARTLVVIAHR